MKGYVVTVYKTIKDEDVLKTMLLKLETQLKNIKENF